ncbi:hypothetical protein AKJ52_02940 [candidate division MSBL1 archaeon SCGC-AAA382C18]|uniref:5'-deoxynucleotidase n=1 Tax=candidate division MSBL1 archaeon SCGC-AAA382C18 TaxID=1698281 RepID=A0A133VHD9_9EURY|nr:hypothetical protein AKJ52_02940 [candidate division MSBL1 archaeon SCGC-AAA382C18]
MYELLKKINMLKRTPRIGWLKSGINPNEAEDVAQHSFETATITLLLGDSLDMGIDSEKALKMAIIHDWAESVTGDFSKDLTDQIGEEMKEEIEEKVLKNLLEEEDKIPKRKEYLNLWHEYSKEKTKEARLVKIADKLSILIEANNLVKNGKSSRELKEIRKKTRDSLNPYVDDFPIFKDLLQNLDEDFSSTIG